MAGLRFLIVWASFFNKKLFRIYFLYKITPFACSIAFEQASSFQDIIGHIKSTILLDILAKVGREDMANGQCCFLKGVLLIS